MRERSRCIDCPYLPVKSTPTGWHCKLLKGCKRTIEDRCLLHRDNMTDSLAIKLLHDYQKYRRGSLPIFSCPSSYLAGLDIDHAIAIMRKNKQSFTITEQ